MRKDYVLSAPTESHAETEFVEEFWTRLWDDVTDIPSPQSVASREEYRIMQPVLDRLPRGSRILDGGCGLGEWTALFASKGFEAWGLDISERTVSRLRELRPEVRFERGDIRRTDFPANHFDAYFSWGAFEHFENGLGDCICEAYRILKPGGVLFISVPYHNWRLVLRDAAPWRKWRGSYGINPGEERSFRFYQWRFTRAELRQELEMRGFTVGGNRAIHKKEGLRRTLQWELNLNPGNIAAKTIVRFLHWLFPAPLLSHMLIATAIKSLAEPYGGSGTPHP